MHPTSFITAALAAACSTVAHAGQEVELPPLATNIEAVLTPHATETGSWQLSASGFRSATPTSNLESFGYASTASAGWEDFTFGAWSDDPSSLDPAFDPHIEYTLQTPEVWAALNGFTTNSHGYTVSEFGLDASVCIDDGCTTPIPNGLAYDPSSALMEMTEFSVSAPSKSKSIRQAVAGSGNAGIALVDALRAEGLSDAEIDAQHPGLLEPEITRTTPATTYNAYLNPLVYTVYNDAGMAVTGSDLIDYLESKQTPQQIIYEIVNGLPLSDPGAIASSTDGDGDGDHSWEDVELEIEITGGVSAETGFPTNSVSAHAEFRIKINASAGEMVDGGEQAVELASEVAQAAVDKVNKTIEEKANGDDDGIGGAATQATIYVVNKAIQFSFWVDDLF